MIAASQGSTGDPAIRNLVTTWEENIISKKYYYKISGRIKFYLDMHEEHREHSHCRCVDNEHEAFPKEEDMYCSLSFIFL